MSETFVPIAVGSFHSCGLLGNGKVHCWGAGLSNSQVEYEYGQRVAPQNISFVQLYRVGHTPVELIEMVLLIVGVQTMLVKPMFHHFNFKKFVLLKVILWTNPQWRYSVLGLNILLSSHTHI